LAIDSLIELILAFLDLTTQGINIGLVVLELLLELSQKLTMSVGNTLELSDAVFDRARADTTDWRLSISGPRGRYANQ
jgi:hypothetical protein